MSGASPGGADSAVRWFCFPPSSADTRGGGEPAASGAFPDAGLTLARAGAMKSARDEENRSRVFASLDIDPAFVISPTQIHSRIVHAVSAPGAWSGYPEGDGVMTRNPALVPCVTVADCMPVYLHDPVTGCFGVLHSGWKGTGIIARALELAASVWGARAADFRVILGPHIGDCCYTVDAERAAYFSQTFGPSCVSADPVRLASGDQWPYRLSLAEANRLLCLSLGIPADHIADTGLCTACGTEFGSNRRQGAGNFTHMAAFIRAHDVRAGTVRAGGSRAGTVCADGSRPGASHAGLD